MSKETAVLDSMSPATKELISKVRLLVPPMLEKFHKGKHLPASPFTR